MLGLAAVTGGHDRASSVDEKLPVVRGMMVLSGSCPHLWREIERPSMVCLRLVFSGSYFIVPMIIHRGSIMVRRGSITVYK